jgi:1,4-alpha-glucan branching enzyme
MPGDEWRRFAGLRSLLAFMWAHPGKQLLFMGSEFGQVAEWSADKGLDWWVLQFPVHSGVQSLVRDLNGVYRSSPALYTQDSVPSGFSWIDAGDAPGNTLSFLRFGSSSERSVLACVVNFSAVPRLSYRVGLPSAGNWREVLNTDAAGYGGSGVGNLGAVVAEDVPWHNQPASAALTVPPLAAIWLAPE